MPAEPSRPYVRSLLRLLARCRAGGRLWIAYSGGLDSHVLLHVAAGLPALRPHAAHVHHGLHPQADAWVEHCRGVCAELGVPLRVLRVDARPAPGESLEAAARDARYAALGACLEAGEGLLTGQHGDDQAETLLLQLLRGAGPAGLAAMPECAPLGRGRLLRPFLGFSRAELHDYARRAGLNWIEDSSNQDVRFDRNFLRQDILPRLKARWPALSATLGRAAAHQAQASRLLDDLGELDLARCAAPPPAFLEAAGAAPRPLALAALRGLSPEHRDNLLRLWLRRHALRPPSTLQLQHILHDVADAGADRQPVLRWVDGEVRRYRGQLFALPHLPAPPADWRVSWDPPAALSLPLGELHAGAGVGAGLDAGLAGLQARLRQGGETCRLRGQTRSLKKLLQEAGVPPWLRPFVPLLYAGETLAAVPGVGVCDGFAARPGAPGWRVHWRLGWG